MSIPFSIVLAALLVACRTAADMPEAVLAVPVPDSGPESSFVSCGEWPSDGLAEVAASKPDEPMDVGCVPPVAENP
jgi:hypothetical protein